jgi:hypothetical protein
MTEQEVFHGVQRIALFMGWTPDEIRVYLTVRYPQSESLGKLAYNTDWNLLIPVVEKINKYLDKNLFEKVGINSLHTRFKLMYVGTPIEDVFRAVVEFIKWYNRHGGE